MKKDSRYRIASVSRRSVTFLDDSGFPVSAQVSGNLYRSCHPVVGDLAEVSHPDTDPVVTALMPRSSVLERTAPLGGRRQLIAANVGLVLVVASLRNPPLRRGFIDRALASCAWRGLRASVVVNKIDLSVPVEDEGVMEGITRDYGPSGAGCGIHMLSCETGEGFDELRRSLAGMTVVMTGQSGTGKTSIALRLNPGLDLIIGELNRKTSKGRHTTVKARLLPLGGETYLIDTPGLRMFSIDHIPPDGLGSCFPEFADLEGGCRFRDCLHDSEPGCAVSEAAESGSLSSERLSSYRALLAELRDGS